MYTLKINFSDIIDYFLLKYPIWVLRLKLFSSKNHRILKSRIWYRNMKSTCEINQNQPRECING